MLVRIDVVNNEAAAQRPTYTLCANGTLILNDRVEMFVSFRIHRCEAENSQLLGASSGYS